WRIGCSVDPPERLRPDLTLTAAAPPRARPLATARRGRRASTRPARRSAPRNAPPPRPGRAAWRTRRRPADRPRAPRRTPRSTPSRSLGRHGSRLGLRRLSRLELVEPVAQPADHAPQVADGVAVADDPEVEVAVVAHHRDVEPHPVRDHGHRI